MIESIYINYHLDKLRWWSSYSTLLNIRVLPWCINIPPMHLVCFRFFNQYFSRDVPSTVVLNLQISGWYRVSMGTFGCTRGRVTRSSLSLYYVILGIKGISKNLGFFDKSSPDWNLAHLCYSWKSSLKEYKRWVRFFTDIVNNPASRIVNGEYMRGISTGCLDV